MCIDSLTETLLFSIIGELKVIVHIIETVRWVNVDLNDFIAFNVNACLGRL
ncbi:hypothetical protein [Shewanella woodyi]|uniref:hypothetical protein n=1 Tax=Shewanella woodyi TaxID=60961 RepID=UPI0012F79993|nr:hypothetical protein [Shewanella woodyi]